MTKSASRWRCSTARVASPALPAGFFPFLNCSSGAQEKGDSQRELKLANGVFVFDFLSCLDPQSPLLSVSPDPSPQRVAPNSRGPTAVSSFAGSPTAWPRTSRSPIARRFLMDGFPTPGPPPSPPCGWATPRFRMASAVYIGHTSAPFTYYFDVSVPLTSERRNRGEAFVSKKFSPNRAGDTCLSWKGPSCGQKSFFHTATCWLGGVPRREGCPRLLREQCDHRGVLRVGGEAEQAVACAQRFPKAQIYPPSQ